MHNRYIKNKHDKCYLLMISVITRARWACQAKAYLTLGRHHAKPLQPLNHAPTVFGVSQYLSYILLVPHPSTNAAGGCLMPVVE